MKKIILSIVALVTITTATTSAQGIYLGPKVGLNFATLSQTSNAKTQVRGLIGGFVGYNLTDRISIQAELLYSWQGTKFDNVSVNIDYFKVPVLAKLRLFENLSAEAGVSFNFLTSAMIQNLSISDRLNGFDFTVPVGLTYLVVEKLEIGLRYDIAPVNIGYPGVSTAKNNVWTFSVGYRF